MSLTPGQRLDHYEIRSVLAHGGMSEVYRAVDLRSGADVVIKVPDIAILGDPAINERFRREVEIGRRLQHPNIHRSLEAGEARSIPYTVMEYVDGRMLRDLVRESGCMSAETAVGLITQLADAVAYSHQHGIFHRDLKPENVLVTPEGCVKLTDFGIALLEGARRVTWRGLSNAFGTPDYMAPEQIQGMRGDARTDVYAMGTILYELLAGRPPFTGDNPLAIMSQHLTAEPTPLRTFRRDVPAPLAATVARAIRRSPDERYQTAEAFKHDLEHPDEVDLSVLDLEPARPISLRASHVRAYALYAGVLVLIILAIIGVGAIAQALQTSH